MNDTNKVENTVNVDRTSLSMPLWKQVIAIGVTISLTASGVWFVSGFAGTDKELVRKTQQLEDTKLDKTVYYSDRQRDSLTITRKLDLIMKHFDIEDYGQEIKKDK